ncbi:MAG: single-stranded DNA-binding protein [Ilumatobacteraceae bacterium]|jgi:single-strand DNA-binding protein|nr:single-stranded DNA-binding protein [Ilumatobacteraceae bacterium]MBJ7487329.1 single-stranded DNA-binding protein [Ilumatobacteraceae bacterium]MCX6528151.1 single-stranded DNA-binding protein [Actinomycetota bacterium]
MADNNITLVGNLTRDPELRFTATGRGVASFGIAVGRRYQVNGEWKEDTSYFNVTAWGQLGENASATLSKGMRCVVSGRLEQREYNNREGEKRSAIEVVADEIGPSLKWATAQVERNPRDANAQGGGASNRGQGGQTAGGDENPFGGEEEPF